MTEKLIQTTKELNEKEQFIQTIEIEKRNVIRKLEAAETANLQLQAKVDLKPQLSLLEADGLHLMDLDANSLEDLRMSLNPEN